MARTRQRAASVKKATSVQKSVGKKAKAQPKPAHMHKVAKAALFADCSDCGQNLKKYGEGGTVGGVLCPPCAAIRFAKDQEKRREQGKKEHLAVLVNDNGTKRKVDLNKEPAEFLLGGGTACTLYHSPYAIQTRGLNPYYTAWIRDCALLEGQPENDTALRVLGRLGGFHERSNESCCGPVVFTGPDNQSLFPNEVDAIFWTD